MLHQAFHIFILYIPRSLPKNIFLQVPMAYKAEIPTSPKYIPWGLLPTMIDTPRRLQCIPLHDMCSPSYPYMMYAGPAYPSMIYVSKVPPAQHPPLLDSLPHDGSCHREIFSSLQVLCMCFAIFSALRWKVINFVSWWK